MKTILIAKVQEAMINFNWFEGNVLETMALTRQNNGLLVFAGRIPSIHFWNEHDEHDDNHILDVWQKECPSPIPHQVGRQSGCLPFPLDKPTRSNCHDHDDDDDDAADDDDDDDDYDDDDYCYHHCHW